MVPAVYNTTIVYTASDLETNYPILVVRRYVLANLIMQKKERVRYSNTARSIDHRKNETNRKQKMVDINSLICQLPHMKQAADQSYT